MGVRERGLLSVAFPPDYRASGRLYVYYTDDLGNIRIDEFHRRSQTRAALWIPATSIRRSPAGAERDAAGSRSAPRRVTLDRSAVDLAGRASRAAMS